MKVTKFFSYADEKVHKLYKSKYSKKKVSELLNSDWKSKFYEMLEKEVRTLLKKILEYNRMKPKDVNYQNALQSTHLRQNWTRVLRFS